MISKQTAMDIALAYREVETAEKLLAELRESKARRSAPDIRDAFGRLQDGLTLGVPCGSDSSRQMFNVPWSLALPIIEAHAASCRARIHALSEAARIENEAPPTGGVETTPADQPTGDSQSPDANRDPGMNQ